MEKENTLLTTRGEKIAYGLGDLGSNFVWTFCSSWLTLYYTDSVLISAGVVGSIMLILRLFDGFSDILFGLLIEKTKTRFGKARPWFGASIIPLVVLQILVYNVPSSMTNATKTIYIVITYFLLTVVAYTINNLSYHSMLSRFALDEKDRVKVSSVRGVFAFLAGLLLAILTPAILNGNGGAKLQSAWTKTSLIFSVICLILQSITFGVVKEKISCEKKDDEPCKKVDLLMGCRELLRIKYFYISIIVFVCTYVLNGLVLAAHVYFTRDVLHNSNLYSLIAIVSVLATVVGIILAPKLFANYGKRKTLICGSLVYIGGCVVGLIFATNILLVIIATVITGIGLGPYVSGIFTFAPDIIELLEVKTGERFEGLVTSVNSVGIKIGTGLASAALGWGLLIGGYDGSEMVQQASVLRVETILVYGVPMVMCFICIIAMKFWDLDERISRN